MPEIKIEKSKIAKIIIIAMIVICFMNAFAGFIGYQAGMRYMYYHHENYTDKECPPCSWPNTKLNLSFSAALPNVSNEPDNKNKES